MTAPHSPNRHPGPCARDPYPAAVAMELRMYRQDRQFYVYILASRKHGTLYIGLTSNLLQRIWQHKQGTIAGFTKKYAVTRLVHYEVFASPSDAIQREKSLKRWPRAWKVNLIEGDNPDWTDLYTCWARAQTQPAGGMDPRDKPEDDNAG